jgi:hypothetical protein
VAGYEASCPLCKAPRAKGQMRCVCNYTFEYERESRPFRRVSGGIARPGRWSTPRIVLITAGVLAVLAGAGVAVWAS